ncbi:MAG: ABC-three component system protein [Planctomycetaceae bacterium]
MRPDVPDDIDYGALSNILQHIVDNQKSLTQDGIPTVPDYDKKILFNGLDAAASLLRVGNYQNSAVDQFFDRHSEFTRSDIRNRLAQAYESAMKAHRDSVSLTDGTGDHVFFRLLNDVAPNARKQVQDAVIVLIAYYFEKCDVFQEPPT